MQSRIVRIAIAFIVAVSVALGSAAALGSSEPLPEDIGLRQAHEEDRFRFDIQYAGSAGDYHYHRQFDVMYGVLAPRTMHDLDGINRAAFILQSSALVTGRSDSDGNSVEDFYHDEVLAYDADRDLGLRSIPPEDADSNEGFFRDVPLPCMLAPAKHGGITGVPDAIDMGACAIDDFGFANLVVKRQGAVKADGQLYVHYRATDVTSTVGVGTMDAWFAEGAPTPVAMKFTRTSAKDFTIRDFYEAVGEQPRGYGVGAHPHIALPDTIDVRIIGYTAGEGPIVTAPQTPTSGHAPALQFAPPAPYGIPETRDPGNLWTPRSAFAFLRGNDDAPLTNAILENGGMAMEAGLWMGGSCYDDAYEWCSDTMRFVFANETHKVETHAARSYADESAMPGVTPAEMDVSYEVQETAREWDGWTQGPSSLPDQIPTLESMEAHLHVVLDTDARMAAQFRWRAPGDSDPLQPFNLRGSETDVSDGSLLEPSSITTRTSGGIFDADYQLSATWGYTWSHETVPLVASVLETVSLLTAESEPAPADTYWTAPGPVGWAGATALGLALGLGVFFLLGSKLFGFGLFSRLDTPQVLEHPVRQQITQTIEANPGIHFQELARQVGKGRGAVEHHLKMLSNHGAIRVAVSPGQTCYFIADQVDYKVANVAPYVRNPTARSILQASSTKRPTTGTLAEGLGLTGGTLTYHAKRLESVGLLRREREGRAFVFVTTELGRNALRQVDPR